MNLKFWKKRSIQSPAVPLTSENILAYLGFSGRSPTGVKVTEEMSLSIAAVYACVKVLSETIASLPLQVFTEKANGRKVAKGSPIYKLLHDEPNNMMTSYYWRMTAVAHTALWGNHYSLIVKNKAGRVVELVPLAPWGVAARRKKGRVVVYKVKLSDGSFDMIPSDEIFHIPALGLDGVQGISPIAQQRNALGLAIATEEFGGRFFANDARPGIVVEVPGNPTQEQIDEIRGKVEKSHRGLGKSHRAMVAPAGIKIHEVGIPPEDAQFLQTRKFQINEIARIFRVPPHLIADLDKATFSNIENQDIGFTKHTIRPWLVNWEQEIKRKLLPSNQFAEFNIDGLMRGDFKTRMEGYAVAVTNGWMTRNEVRKIENMEPLAGLDAPLTPMNLGTANGQNG